MSFSVTTVIILPENRKTSSEEGQSLLDGGAGGSGGSRGTGSLSLAECSSLEEVLQGALTAATAALRDAVSSNSAREGRTALKSELEPSGAFTPKLLASSPASADRPSSKSAQLQFSDQRMTKEEALDVLKDNFAAIDASDGWDKTNGNGTLEKTELEAAAQSSNADVSKAAKTVLEKGDAWADLSSFDGDGSSLSMQDLAGAGGSGQAAALAASQEKIKALAHDMPDQTAMFRIRDRFDEIKDRNSGYISMSSLDAAIKDTKLPPELRAACMRARDNPELFKAMDNGADALSKSDGFISAEDLRVATGGDPGKSFGLGLARALLFPFGMG